MSEIDERREPKNESTSHALVRARKELDRLIERYGSVDKIPTMHMLNADREYAINLAIQSILNSKQLTQHEKDHMLSDCRKRLRACGRN